MESEDSRTLYDQAAYNIYTAKLPLERFLGAAFTCGIISMHSSSIYACLVPLQVL